MIKSKQLARALFELSQDNQNKDLDAKFFDFMEKRRLTAQLPSVIYHFEKIMEQDAEKKGLQIEVAHPISAETAKKIKTHLQAENFPEILKIKNELIGGFRAKWQGKIYDASFATGLKKLEQAIIN